MSWPLGRGLAAVDGYTGCAVRVRASWHGMLPGCPGASTEREGASFVVAGANVISSWARLTGEKDPLLDVRRLQDVVVVHADVTLDQDARTRAAMPFTAGVRGVDPLIEQEVHQL